MRINDQFSIRQLKSSTKLQCSFIPFLFQLSKQHRMNKLEEWEKSFYLLADFNLWGHWISSSQVMISCGQQGLYAAIVKWIHTGQQHLAYNSEELFLPRGKCNAGGFSLKQDRGQEHSPLRSGEGLGFPRHGLMGTRGTGFKLRKKFVDSTDEHTETGK